MNEQETNENETINNEAQLNALLNNLPVVQTHNPRGNIFFLPIIGQIEGHMILPPNTKTTKYEHIMPQLFTAAENQSIDGILIVLNTLGGDVEAGLCIAELIAKLGKPVVSLVLGGGHSIGVPLAVSASHSFIAASATMTIHPIRLNGTVVTSPQSYDYFNKMQDRVLDFIVANSKISKKSLNNLMFDNSKLVLDLGSVLIGAEAVENNIIDEVGGLANAMEKLYELIAQKKQEEATLSGNDDGKEKLNNKEETKTVNGNENSSKKEETSKKSNKQKKNARK